MFWIIICASAVLLAKVEIEIEGAHGWAEKLPTRRFAKNHPLSRIIFGGRPATLYHVYLQLFVIMFAHISYAVTQFSWAKEARICAFIIFFWICEDFFWFVFNPHFGIRKFKKEYIWWHKDQWWGIMPREYVIWAIVGIILLSL